MVYFNARETLDTMNEIYFWWFACCRTCQRWPVVGSAVYSFKLVNFH